MDAKNYQVLKLCKRREKKPLYLNSISHQRSVGLQLILVDQKQTTFMHESFLFYSNKSSSLLLNQSIEMMICINTLIRLTMKPTLFYDHTKCFNPIK